MTKIAEGVDCGQLVTGRQCDDQLAMNQRQRARRHDQATIRHARERHDAALDLVGIAHVDRGQLYPNEGATAWIAANWPIPVAISGSRRTATRVDVRRDLLEQLQPFPARAVFEARKPVTLPPGRAKLSTKPAPTGSGTRRTRSARCGSPVATAPRSACHEPRLCPAPAPPIPPRICECVLLRPPPHRISIRRCVRRPAQLLQPL